MSDPEENDDIELAVSYSPASWASWAGMIVVSNSDSSNDGSVAASPNVPFGDGRSKRSVSSETTTKHLGRL